MSDQVDLTNAVLQKAGVIEAPSTAAGGSSAPSFDPASVCEKYDLWSCNGKYYWKEDDCFREFGPQDIARSLRVAGYSRREIDDSTTGGKIPSQLDRILDHAVRFRAVAFAGEVAGHKAGVHGKGSKRYLITTSPVIIEPIEGECPIILEFLRVLLGEDGSMRFRLWLKFGFQALRNGRRQQGQCLVLCGPSGKGKGVLQSFIITPVLGGRSANPKKWLLDKDQFNTDLVGAEHLMVEEMPSSNRHDERVALAERIKEICVNHETRQRDMHSKGRSVNPLWRLSMSLNDAPENLRVFPPLIHGFKDKLMFLRTSSEEFLARYDAIEEGFQVFLGLVENELPAFADHLLALEVPEERKDRRYGVCSYVDPVIEDLIYQQEPQSFLLTLIDEMFGESLDFKDDGSGQLNPWTGSATDLKEKLTDSSSKGHTTARKILDSHVSHIGSLLGRLEEKFPERFSRDRDGKARAWTIQPPFS